MHNQHCAQANLQYPRNESANSSLRNLSASAQLKTASSLLEDLSSKLSGCPSDYYVIASQPGVHSNDFSTLKSAPRLGAKLTGKDHTIRSRTIINEVVGVLEARKVQELIEAECGAQSTIIDASCKHLDLGKLHRTTRANSLSLSWYLLTRLWR